VLRCTRPRRPAAALRWGAGSGAETAGELAPEKTRLLHKGNPAGSDPPRCLRREPKAASTEVPQKGSSRLRRATEVKLRPCLSGGR